MAVDFLCDESFILWLETSIWRLEVSDRISGRINVRLVEILNN
jgi:hypothetical protein